MDIRRKILKYLETNSKADLGELAVLLGTCLLYTSDAADE